MALYIHHFEVYHLAYGNGKRTRMGASTALVQLARERHCGGLQNPVSIAKEMDISIVMGSQTFHVGTALSRMERMIRQVLSA